MYLYAICFCAVVVKKCALFIRRCIVLYFHCILLHALIQIYTFTHTNSYLYLFSFFSEYIYFFSVIFYFTIHNCVMHFKLHVHCLCWPNAESFQGRRMGLGSCISSLNPLITCPGAALGFTLIVSEHHQNCRFDVAVTNSEAMANWVNGTNVASSLFRSTCHTLVAPHKQTINFNIQPKNVQFDFVLGYELIFLHFRQTVYIYHMFFFCSSSCCVFMKTRCQILN